MADTQVEPAPTASEWYLPFLWIMLIPVLTWSLGWFLLYGLGACEDLDQLWKGGSIQPRCPVEAVLQALLLPGLLNLTPFLFALFRERRTKYAGLVAGSLGAVRLVVPALISVASGPTVTFETHALDAFGFVSFVSPDNASIGASMMLWLLSGLTFAVFPLAVKAEATTTEVVDGSGKGVGGHLRSMWGAWSRGPWWASIPLFPLLIVYSVVVVVVVVAGVLVFLLRFFSSP